MNSRTKETRVVIALVILGTLVLTAAVELALGRLPVTISLGYVGDSVLNSVSDVLMVLLGYAIASRARLWTSIALAVVFELGLAWWVRDNLTLNIIMLVHPVDAIRTWQMVGQPH